MDVLDRLIAASKNTVDLAEFIEENIEELYEFLLTQGYADLNNSKEKIDSYILPHLKVIRTLDFNIESTRIFTTLLLDASERFGFLMPFQQLYKLVIKNGCKVGCRLEASALYLIGIRTISDYENAINPLLKKLSLAFNNEEDTEDKVIGTLINYYAQVLYNFGSHNIDGVLSIKENLLSNHDNPEFYFLRNKIVTEVLNVDIQEYLSAYHKIQILLDVFLKRTKEYNSLLLEEILLEENTKYSQLLKSVHPHFSSIRQVSVNQYSLIADDSIFYSLQRGVKVLMEENQLFAYMNSYGNMHYNKLISSFAFLPDTLFVNPVNIIDWGCGQGLATIAFLEFLDSNQIGLQIKNITLIEPSLLALKRASLHVKKFDDSVKINTINKDIDAILKTDLKKVKSTTKIHLLSNILDIDLFSLPHLLDLINSTLAGENCFVCVSPYVNDIKTHRIDSFVNFFSKKKDYEMIKTINNKTGEWINGWTRIIRVFKVTI